MCACVHVCMRACVHVLVCMCVHARVLACAFYVPSHQGDYDTFERTRNERLRNQAKAVEANERTRAHIQV